MQCVDITFAEPGDPRIPLVNETNCFNSTDIGIGDVYTLTLRASGQGAVNATSGAGRVVEMMWSGRMAWAGYGALAVGGLWALL